MNDQTQADILKDLASGKYRDRYVAYVRKSTDEPENQKNSIAFQKAEIAKLAKRENLRLAPLTIAGLCTDGVISERHSAFKEGAEMAFGDDGVVSYRVERPKFHRLASLLSAGHFRGVIFLCWDRASRNKGDELIIRKLMKAGVDVRFVLATYDASSAGELHKDIDGMFAEHHSRITREKVKDAIEKSRERGWCTHRAPVGYLNTGSMQRKPLDPERAPYIRQLFARAASTDWSLSDLRRWLIAEGFTMPPARRKRTKTEMLEDEEQDGRRKLEKVCGVPSVSMVHAILTNPFYTGKVWGNDGGWTASTSHEPLVSEAIFARVQERLARRRVSVRHEKKLDLPFRGFLRCGCGRVFTPYEQKGHVYFGARCDRSCENPRRSVNLALLDTIFRDRLDKLVFTPSELAQVDAAAERMAAQSVERQAAAVEVAGVREARIRDDLTYLADNAVMLLRTGAFTPDGLAAERARLENELAGMESDRGLAAENPTVIARLMRKLSELLETANSQYELMPGDVQETYVRLVFSELIIFGNTLKLRCRTAFAPFERRLFDFSAPSCSVSELLNLRPVFDEAIEELTAILQQLESAVERP